MVFLCYDRCSTCKKAKKFLDERGAAYTVRPIKEENPSKEEIILWQKESGLSMNRFFNTSGQAYREMGLKDRLPNMSDEEKAELLSTDGMLVKRPILIGDGFVLVGFKEAEWTEKIG